MINLDDDLDLNAMFGIVPTPSAAPGESASMLEVPSSPDALDLGCDTFDDTDVFLNSIFNQAETHPEVIFDSEASTTACGGALLATRSDSFTQLKQEMQQEVEEDDADADLSPPGSPLPEASAMEIHGEFAVTAPPKGKPLYAAPAGAAERAIQKLFPEWTLRLQRNEFNKWKKQNRVRKLTAGENDVLKKFRRTMLARVYADRARRGRAARHGAAASQVGALKAENKKLRQRLAFLEAQAAGR